MRRRPRKVSGGLCWNSSIKRSQRHCLSLPLYISGRVCSSLHVARAGTLACSPTPGSAHRSGEELRFSALPFHLHAPYYLAHTHLQDGGTAPLDARLARGREEGRKDVSIKTAQARRGLPRCAILLHIFSLTSVLWALAHGPLTLSLALPLHALPNLSRGLRAPLSRLQCVRTTLHASRDTLSPLHQAGGKIIVGEHRRGVGLHLPSPGRIKLRMKGAVHDHHAPISSRRCNYVARCFTPRANLALAHLLVEHGRTGTPISETMNIATLRTLLLVGRYSRRTTEDVMRLYTVKTAFGRKPQITICISCTHAAHLLRLSLETISDGLTATQVCTRCYLAACGGAPHLSPYAALTLLSSPSLLSYRLST